MEHLLRVFHVHVVILHRHVSVTPLTFLRVSYNTSAISTQYLYLILVCVFVCIYIRILVPHPDNGTFTCRSWHRIWLGAPGFNSWQDQETFPFSKGPDGNEAFPACCLLNTGCLRDGKPDHSPPSSTEVENECSCTSPGRIALMLRTGTAVCPVIPLVQVKLSSLFPSLMEKRYAVCLYVTPPSPPAP